MDIESLVEKKIHISNLDDFLASALLECQEKPIKLSIQKEGIEGYVSVNLLKSEENMEEDGIDFELSPCECINFDSMEISDFLYKPVFSSSAYEFFDFVFMFFSSIECLVDFTGDAWKVKILKTEYP
ncbi:MAG TPA: hypothetical protein VI935_07630 [Thermodesulfobacteriota bacterium]|nr:hypothetical protein [Thermodesulfobacteriota bacterium]